MENYVNNSDIFSSNGNSLKKIKDNENWIINKDSKSKKMYDIY